jgi:hypothetical protein
MKLPRSSIVLVAALLTLLPEARGQWVQQSISLRPGWNAIFLEVDPVPEDCDTLFAGLPVESVWDSNRVGDSPQFIQDPSTLLPGAPGWLTWYPSGHPLAGLGNLFILRDGRPYLIKLADNAQTVIWTVTGRPSLRPIIWQAGAVNLVGFHVAATGPTFQSLFAGETGLAAQPVFSLDTAGIWRQVANPAVTRPRAGEAYWVRCRLPAQRAGTIVVDAGSRQGLDFGDAGTEQNLRVRNTSSTSRNVTLRLLVSATPPGGQLPLAGPVPLQFYRANYATAEIGWEPMSSPLNSGALAPGAEWKVRLGVRRAAIAEGLAPGARYQSILEATDDLGTRWLIPVRAEAGAAPVATAGGGFLAAAANASRTGLWMGEAVINQVSQPAHPGDPLTPRAAGGEFSFRLIVHADSAGSTRLLQRVYFVRKPATFIPDPANPGFNLVDQPPRTLLLTDEALIPGLIGNSPVIGRRVSSAAFGFEQPVALTGGEFGGGTLGGIVTLDYNHPLNPFKHVFHPDHNNRDERFEQTLPEGRESFTVTRTIALEFTDNDPLGLTPPGWGDSEFGGVYRETITGLHRNTIHLRGNFRLVRASRVAALNGG